MDKVTVVGAGTMGHGIALASAQAGHETLLVDVDGQVLERALEQVGSTLEKGVAKGKVTAALRDETLARLSTTTSIKDAADAGVLIEAVPEELALKRRVLAELEQAVGAQALIATNTSSLSIGSIAEHAGHPERVLGLHFFNPVHVMQLVEVVVGPATSDENVERAQAFVRGLARVPIVVRDSPGFASSRLGVALGLEAIRMVEDGVASAEDIDTAMELGYRHPMGPLRLTDLVGLDVRLDIAQYLEQELGERFAPPALLRTMVAEGRLGRKTGEGFYRY